MKTALAFLLAMLFLQVHAQEIWLQRSDGKVISSFDTLVEQSFFEKHSFTLRSLEPIPVEAEFYFLLFYKDSTKPSMGLMNDGPVLSKYTRSYLAESSKGTRVHVLVQIKTSNDSTRSYSQLTFTLVGNPIGKIKPLIIHNQKIWLENSRRKKLSENDSIITPEFWKSKKMAIKTAVPIGLEDNIWCLVYTEQGNSAMYKMNDGILSNEIIQLLDNSPSGSKLQILLQVAVIKREETLPKPLNLRIVK